MLRIRKEQLDHFASQTREHFVATMLTYVTTHFGDWVDGLDPSRVRAWIVEILSVGEQRGIVLQPEAAQWIVLALLLERQGISSEDWVTDAIASKIVPIGKIRRLIAAMRERAIPELHEAIVLDELHDPEV